MTSFSILIDYSLDFILTPSFFLFCTQPESIFDYYASEAAATSQ